MNISSSSKIGDFAFDAQSGKIKSGYMALRLFCNFQHAYSSNWLGNKFSNYHFFSFVKKLRLGRRDEINERRGC